jgi:hypothetical protein
VKKIAFIAAPLLLIIAGLGWFSYSKSEKKDLNALPKEEIVSDMDDISAVPSEQEQKQEIPVYKFQRAGQSKDKLPVHNHNEP